MSDLTAEVLKQSELNTADEASICALYQRYYESCAGSVASDLREKDYVIVLRDQSGTVQGFSTVLLIKFSFGGIQRSAIFSGDTVIHHDYWGTQALSLSWCEFAGTIKAADPEQPLYWFLIVKGYRTYRYLPLFSKVFYPNRRYQTPPEVQMMIDYLAKSRFGDSYYAEQGIVRFPESRGHLREQWADIPARVQNHPDVEYFLERNPDYNTGDELVCFTELSEDNLRSYALRAFTKALF
ncbi:MAG TPA: hypothetical protein ENJ32_14100 [Crenotrichaceae bacterium]|nr:hypothetical protein [Crenotrichaceae bacterium]